MSSRRKAYTGEVLAGEVVGEVVSGGPVGEVCGKVVPWKSRASSPLRIDLPPGRVPGHMSVPVEMGA